MKRFPFICVFVCFVISLTSHISAEPPSREAYKVHVDDVLSIAVLDHRELSVQERVGEDGSISFPYIGSVYVKNMTLSEIKEEITNRLAEGYVKYPVVSVSLAKAVVRKILTYGEFLRRGEIPFEENLTLLAAMSLAGGVSIDGLYGKLKVKRKQKNLKYKEMLETELFNGDIRDKKISNMLLQPDDILIIERSKTFLIQGEVARRGRFTLEKDMTVLRALLESGGVSSDGLYGTVKIRRKQEGVAGGYKDIGKSRINEGVIESREVEDILLQPDDILIVERSKTFLIQGEVAKRGRFVLEKDMTVLRALLESGGVSSDGLYGTVKIRRKQEGAAGGYEDIGESKINEGVIESREVEDILLQPDDILIVERSTTFLIQGEVAKRGRFVLEKDMTVLRALLESGGVTEDGLYGTVKVRRKQEGAAGGYEDLGESKINEGVIESREVEDILLQPDDILIVGKSKTYFVYGEVTKVGEFVLEGDMTVFRALTIAGGLTKWGSESRVEVLRPKQDGTGFETIKVDIDDVLEGDTSADILLEAGDTIVASKGVF